MKVELRQHVGYNIATHEEEKLPQYRIFIDGRPKGFIGWQPGAKVLLTEPYGPIERKEIERQVAKLLSQKTVESVPAPDVPEEMLQPKEEDDVYVDDFDPS